MTCFIRLKLLVGAAALVGLSAAPVDARPAKRAPAARVAKPLQKPAAGPASSPAPAPEIAPAGAVPALPAETPPLSVGLATAADPRATAAGMQILRQGGSAADAAMAMMLALTVVEPQSSGIGGGGFLVAHDAATGAIATIDGRETAPAAATPGRFLDPAGQPIPFMSAAPGGRSVGVPGNIRLAALAHEKWGKLPWADLFEPAIQLAEGGFEASASLAARLDQMKGLWAQFPDARAIYWPSGSPAVKGELIRNPALAATLTRIAEQGPEAFYSGQTAQELVAAIAASPVARGDLTPLDLTAYRAKERPPVCMAYRLYKVCGMGPPSSGGITVLQILGMLQPFDMAKSGPGAPVSWHRLSEAMRLAYADRDRYLADPDFVDVPVEGLLDPAYLKERSALISDAKARTDYPAGTPPLAEPRTDAPSAEVPSTTHFVAIDKAGNIATMTSTVEGPFGSQLIASGYVLNNELTDFSFVPERDGAPVANRVEAGKRPLSSMAPTIVYDLSGRPVLTLGSAGGKRIIMHVAKTLVGVLDFGLPLKDAIALPNIYFNGDDLLVEQGTGLAAAQEAMSAFGHPAVPADLPSKVNGAQLTAAGWIGAADNRSEGTVEAQ